MKIAIIGTGSWATALAQVLTDNKIDVFLYGIAQDEIDDINRNHRNSKYFACAIAPGIKATNDITKINTADTLLMAVPVKAIRSVLGQIKATMDHPFCLINVAKGFDPLTDQRLSVVIKDILGTQLRSMASLIGPSHAEEVILRLLTAVNIVSDDQKTAQQLQQVFANDYFRVYTNDDVIGAEIAAATKNIMAIASGILTGLNQGDNARAALMTRGIYEMTRFGLHYGAKKETFLGLNGVGDLIVTCSSYHSRNFKAGLAIGKADDAQAFLATNKVTTEGIYTTKVIHELALAEKIDMPITAAVYNVLYERQKPSVVIKELMNRPLKVEKI